MTEIRHLRVATTLQLDPPSGPPLEIREVTADVLVSEHSVTGLVITFQIARSDWDRVDAERLFHLTPDVRGNQFEPFHPETPVEIEAQLLPESVVLASILGETEYDVGALLYPSGPAEIRSTEAWRALYVKQQDGPIKFGFVTTYAEADPRRAVTSG